MPPKVSRKTPGAGRKKGTPNKKTLALEEVCAKHNCHPFEGMVILSQTTFDESIKLGCLKELCSYLYPKRKALELSGPDGGPIESGLDAESKILLDEFKNVVETMSNERRKA